MSDETLSNKTLTNKTLFERIGGEDAVDALVDLFYRKVLADDSLSSFLDGVDMDAQRARQKVFLTAVFGGSDNYSGKDLLGASEDLAEKDLTEPHFVAVAVKLQAALKELNVPTMETDEVMAIAGATISLVLDQDTAVADGTKRSTV